MDTNAALFNYDAIIPWQHAVQKPDCLSGQICAGRRHFLVHLPSWHLERHGHGPGRRSSGRQPVLPLPHCLHTGPIGTARAAAHGMGRPPGPAAASGRPCPFMQRLLRSILAAYQILRLTAPSRDLFSSTNNALTLVYCRRAPPEPHAAELPQPCTLPRSRKLRKCPCPPFCLNWIVSCGTGNHHWALLPSGARYQVLAKHKGSHERPRILEVLLVSGIAPADGAGSPYSGPTAEFSAAIL